MKKQIEQQPISVSHINFFKHLQQNLIPMSTTSYYYIIIVVLSRLSQKIKHRHTHTWSIQNQTVFKNKGKIICTNI
jgi:ATP-dependent protease Clp ATPase subunit